MFRDKFPNETAQDILDETRSLRCCYNLDSWEVGFLTSMLSYEVWSYLSPKQIRIFEKIYEKVYSEKEDEEEK